MLKKQGSPINTIYSDSVTAMAWVRDRKCKSKIDECAENAYLFSLVRRAEKWLRENTYTTRILKWRTDEWGEIPADFGRK
jgi:ribonuclease HI